jgi:DNA-binding transcriptional MerR regulator
MNADAAVAREGHESATVAATAVTEQRRRPGAPPPSRRRWLPIGDVAREHSITLRALRFYESKGLITPLRQGAQRLYSPEDRARIGLILAAKELGFTLTEIAGLLDETPDSGELALKPEIVLRQIGFLERQHRSIEAALANLRLRYYTLTEKDVA